MRTTDNFDHEPPRKAATESRTANTAARNQAPRQPVRRPPVQMDNDSYDDDIRYEDDVDEQQDEYDPEYDDYDEQTPWYDSFWFICVCLVICPPYALYRIWKDERFSVTNRWLISAIDVCWMLIILILLFSMLFGRDNSANTADGLNASPTQAIDISSPSPDPNASQTTTSDPNATAAPTLAPGATLAPTIAGGATLPTTVPGSTQKPGATNQPGVTLKPSATGNATTDSNDKNQLVWYTSSGTYYHSDKTCGGTMSGATQHTLAEAQAAGKRRCPYCYDGVSRDTVVTSNTNTNTTTTKATARPTVKVTAKPTVKVTAKPTVKVTAGPTPAPTPVSTSPYAVMVYFNVNGQYYHSISNCQGMKNAGYYTIGQAIDAGKRRCPICNAPEPGSTVTPSPSPVPTPTPLPTKVIHIVWYTDTGTYYHSISTCTGMKGALRHTLGEAIDANKLPCPICNPPRQ